MKDRFGDVSSKRFWVKVPYTPPPSPEEPSKPTFSEIKQFREEFGLDRDLNPATEQQQINNRIYDLLAAWSNPQTPEGEVARSSAEKWGVPMRPVDVAEMEYREWYIEADGPLIEEWGYSHYPSSYAGYRVNEAAGGIIEIGFTASQSERIAELIQQVHPAAPDRITAMSPAPTQPRMSLESLEEEVLTLTESDPELSSWVKEVGLAESGNVVVVGTSNVAATEARLLQRFGTLNRLEVLLRPEPEELLSGRYRQGGRMLAGERIATDWTPNSAPLWTWATAGFGAVEKKFLENEKRYVKTRFLLTAGHAGNTGAFIYRIANRNLGPYARREQGEKIGRVGRDPFFEGSAKIDALAMRFDGDGLAPRRIFGEDGHRPSVGPAAVAHIGEHLCTSGAASNRVKCGKVIGFNHVNDKDHPQTVGVITVLGLGTIPGDSGAPVWNPRTGRSVGLIQGRALEGNKKRRWVQPLLTTQIGKGRKIVGALNATVMGSLSLITGP